MSYRFDALIEWSDWTSGREEHAQAIAAALRSLVGSSVRLRNLHLITSASSGPAILEALRDAGAGGSPLCRHIVPWLKPTMGLLALRPDGDAMSEFIREANILAGYAGQDSYDRRVGLDLETWISPYYRGDATADWKIAGDRIADSLRVHSVDSCYVLHPTIQDHLPTSESIRAGFFAGSESRATRGLVGIDTWGQWARAKHPQPDAEARWTAQNGALRIRVRHEKRIVRPITERNDWTPAMNQPWYADDVYTLLCRDEMQLLSLPADPEKLAQVCATMARTSE
ncbi:MAG: hypothetical protein JETCAE02_26860 [Anaerolineaceae bacterium]|nr:MAG: hypothetical protein JETCAE02_26860 [Anaerolineaceae bacterium]